MAEEIIATSRPEDPLWTRWLKYADDDLNNPKRCMTSAPQLLRRIVDEETKPLHVKLEQLEAKLAAAERERDEARSLGGEHSPIAIACRRARQEEQLARERAMESELAALREKAETITELERWIQLDTEHRVNLQWAIIEGLGCVLFRGDRKPENIVAIGRGKDHAPLIGAIREALKQAAAVRAAVEKAES